MVSVEIELFLYLKKIITFIQKGCIKLIKNDVKTFIKDFCLKKKYIFWRKKNTKPGFHTNI